MQSEMLAARAKSSEPGLLTLETLEIIRADAFADDVEIPAEAITWSKADAVAYFESGGVVVPKHADRATLAPSTVGDVPIAASVPSKPLLWSNTDAFGTLSAAFSFNAHADQSVSRVRLFHDIDGVVAAPGEVVAISGGWDYHVRIWRICDAAGNLTPSVPEAVCVPFGPERWVYDLAVVGLMGGETRPQLGIISVQTGGMVGDPENVIQLWRVGSSGGGSSATAEIVSRLNCVDAVPTAEPTPRNRMKSAHIRGVHAVDYSRGFAVTHSQDQLAAWSLDTSLGRGSLAASVDSPLGSSSIPGRIHILRDGRTVLPCGPLQEDSLALLDLGAGLRTVETLEMRGGAAIDAAELADPHSGTARVVAAAPNRAFLWDRRSGRQACARLPLQHISALASVAGGAAGAAPALLAASGQQVHVYDVRRLPENTAAAKRPPPALASLEAVAGAEIGTLTSLAINGSVVAAGSSNGSLCAWDVAAL